MSELPPDDDADPLVARLRTAGPTGGLGVDFAGVVAEVARRRRRAQTLRVAGSALVLVGAIGMASRIGNLGVGGQSASSAGAGPMAASAAQPERSEKAAPSPVVASGDAADVVTYAADRTATGCPVSLTWDSAVLDFAAPTRITSAIRLPDGPPADAAGSLPQLTDRLVPATGALSATVCRYDPLGPVAAGAPTVAPSTTLTLDAERAVTTQAGALAAGLAALRPGVTTTTACPLPSSAVASWLLVRVTYDVGVVWVAVVDDGCRQLASNGLVHTSQPIAAALRGLLDTGTWGP